MKLKQFFLALAAVLMTTVSFAQVGIGTNTPDPSSILDVNVDNLPANAKKGFLPPRMTTEQRNAITSPANGLIIFNTSIPCLQVNLGTPAIPNWQCVSSQNVAAEVVSFDCNAAAVNNGTLTQGLPANNVSTTVSYTGGNGGTYASQIIQSNISGLSATLFGGNLANGDGTLIFIISGTPATSGTATFTYQLGDEVCSFTRTVGAGGPVVTALDCGNAAITGTLTANTAASGVFAAINYTGGNGAAYSSQIISSTGVTGLVASLPAGTLTNGSGGVLTFSITGTPVSSGVASFALTFGGVSCSFTVNVNQQAAVATLVCSSSTPAGTLTAGQAAAGVSQTIPYTGGNGANYPATSFASSGVSGLTANLAAGALVNGNGSIVLTITGTPATSGTATFNINLFGTSCTFTRTVATPPATISTLTCGSATFSPSTITSGVAYTGTMTVPYTGGNGSAYSAGSPIGSTTITGLTATLQAGTLATGAGNLTYTVSGTPSGVGTANFALSFPNATGCTVSKSVTTPTITGLTCASVTFNTLPVVRGLEYTGTVSVPYTGGNGLAYPAGAPIASTGVTGLTATLVAGTLNNGNGNLTYTISGVPNPSTFSSVNFSTAIFSISFGTASCDISIPITNCVSNVAVVNDLISPTTGRRWMDRNLGAYRAATSSTDIMAYGDLYQYGRRTDGHQCRYSATTSTISTTTSVPAPDTDKYIALVNWYSGTSPSLSQLWNPTGTGVNEVCPSGYRVPTQTEWQAEVAGWNAATAAADAFNTLKLTMGGQRTPGGGTGALINVDFAGDYHSSTAGSGVRTLNFTANTISTTTNNNFGSGRSVRCIKI